MTDTQVTSTTTPIIDGEMTEEQRKASIALLDAKQPAKKKEGELPF